MQIPSEARKCVAFIGAKRADGSYLMMGSGFFLGPLKVGLNKVEPCYLVTARHVIDKALALGAETIGVRLNATSGNAEWHDVSAHDWFVDESDPSVDVAVRVMGIPSTLDHLALSDTLGVTNALISENEVGPGDEVFITGLFRHHHGAARNIPIIRVGALSCMSEEKIQTSVGEMDALLVEVRSIGGLSGSPVFLYLGNSRPVKGEISFASKIYLLGLIHGHYDATDGDLDAADAGLTTAKINTGMAIVVPFHTINSVIELQMQHQKKLLSGALSYTLGTQDPS